MHPCVGVPFLSWIEGKSDETHHFRVSPILETIPACDLKDKHGLRLIVKEHLLGQLRHGEGSILLRTARGQRGEACHEEVQPGEGHKVHRDLAQVAIQLPREAQTTSNSRHCCGDQVVQVAVGRCCQLQCAEANVVPASNFGPLHNAVCSTEKLKAIQKDPLGQKG